jgi:type II secretory pathway component PulK
MRQQGLAGMAIILITMIVSMAAMVVTNLTYSTFLSGRSVGMVERQLQAEYALKSLINVAAALIAADSSPELDAKEDVWALFMSGAPVPPEILAQLGFDSNMQVMLEIIPENSKLRLDQIDPMSSPSGSAYTKKWKDIYAALFRKIGFDDQLSEPDHTGLFPNQVFSSQQLADNLETFMRTDKQDPSSKMPTGNGEITRIGELLSIPGFTPARVSALTPYVTLTGDTRVNVNVALPFVLDALDPELDSATIVNYREGTGPIESISQLGTIIPQSVADRLTSYLSTGSTYFQVIGKIEYGGGLSFFAKAIVLSDNSTRNEAKITSLLLY